jgi:hypothetical protein
MPNCRVSQSYYSTISLLNTRSIVVEADDRDGALKLVQRAPVALWSEDDDAGEIRGCPRSC